MSVYEIFVYWKLGQTEIDEITEKQEKHVKIDCKYSKLEVESMDKSKQYIYINLRIYLNAKTVGFYNSDRIMNLDACSCEVK